MGMIGRRISQQVKISIGCFVAGAHNLWRQEERIYWPAGRLCAIKKYWLLTNSGVKPS